MAERLATMGEIRFYSNLSGNAKRIDRDLADLESTTDWPVTRLDEAASVGVASKSAPKWKLRLALELGYREQLEQLTDQEIELEVRRRGILSSNYDTVASIDWPHYCGSSTEGCGGSHGWCYTFAGHRASAAQSRKVALVDLVARRLPELFGELVALEVRDLVRRGRLRYPNVRYSGSGELHPRHLSALKLTADRGVHLWGFTRSLSIARRLRAANIACLVSCDKTSPPSFIEKAIRDGFRLAYTSISVSDLPPKGTLVTFPVHVSGRVGEVVDEPSLCPKVVDEYFARRRTEAWCQERCSRCHQISAPTL